MYTKGELKLTDLECATVDEDGDCENPLHCHSVYDSRNGNNKTTRAAFLPHSCQAWVIGDVQQIEAMIADLQDATIQLTQAQQPEQSSRAGDGQESQQDR